MAEMSYREKINLAHQLGAKYELGYWKFPTEEAKAEFRRKSTGMEWTQQQRDVADDALLAHRDAMMANKTFVTLA